MRDSEAAARDFLVRSFQAHGYVRLPNQARRSKVGSQVYKKGFEVRLVADSPSEVERLRAALHVLGLRPGRAFPKHSRIVVPVYGRKAVDFFRRSR